MFISWFPSIVYRSNEKTLQKSKNGKKVAQEKVISERKWEQKIGKLGFLHINPIYGQYSCKLD